MSQQSHNVRISHSSYVLLVHLRAAWELRGISDVVRELCARYAADEGASIKEVIARQEQAGPV